MNILWQTIIPILLFQAIVGDKTIAFFLMDREMYSGMSCLVDASPTIERGVALHKVFLLPLCKKHLFRCWVYVLSCLSEQSLSFSSFFWLNVYIADYINKDHNYQISQILFTTYMTDKVVILLVFLTMIVGLT